MSRRITAFAIFLMLALSATYNAPFEEPRNGVFRF